MSGSSMWGMSGGPGGSNQTGHAEARAKQAADDVQRLSERLDRLLLVNMAMWSLLQEKTGLTEQDLKDRVHDLDMADGQLDGKSGKLALRCPKCGRVMSPRHRRCLYCGEERKDYSAFDAAR